MTLWTRKVHLNMTILAFLIKHNFVVSGPIWIFFSLFDLEIWWGFKIRYCTFPEWLSWPQQPYFVVSGPIWIIFFLWLGNSMGIPNLISYFPQMTVWTTKVQLPFLWTDLNIFFSFSWKFDGDSKSDVLNFVFLNVFILVFSISWFKNKPHECFLFRAASKLSVLSHMAKQEKKVKSKPTGSLRQIHDNYQFTKYVKWVFFNY